MTIIILKVYEIERRDLYNDIKKIKKVNCTNDIV